MKFLRNMEFYRWERKDMIAPTGRNTSLVSIFSTSMENAKTRFEIYVRTIGDDPLDYVFIGTTTVMNSMIEFERYA